MLETRTTAYALGLNEDGLLVHCYWGARLPRLEDYPPAPNATGWASFNGPAHVVLPLEYPGYGGVNYTEPCLKVAFANGVRDVVPRFERAEQPAGAPTELDVHPRDAYYPLSVTLHYRVHEDYDLIERWASIHHESDESGGPVMLERVWSAQWHPSSGT